MTRAGLVLRGWGGAAVGVAVAVALVGLPHGRSDGAAAAARGARFDGALLPPRTPVPDVALRDERGRTVRLRTVRGPYVVTFLTAVCRDACPVSAQTVRLALDRVGGDVPAFAVAVDPSKDTTLNARRFLARQGLLGRMRFLLGDRRALVPAWRGFAVQPVTAASDHQARIVLVDRHGNQRVGYFAETATPEALAHDLRLLLNRRSAGS